MRVIKSVIYLLVLLCAACNLNPQGSASPTTTPTFLLLPTEGITPEPVSNTYTNNAYGYTLQIPDGLTVDGDSSSQFLWIGDQIWVMVSEINPENALGDGPVIEFKEDTQIAGIPSRQLSGYVGAIGGNTPQRYVSVVIPHNNLYYQFMAYELKKGDVQPIDRTMGEVPDVVRVLLEQVVTSIQFTS